MPDLALEDELLSDEQVEQLFQQAESRLRAQVLDKQSTPSIPSLPRLDISTLPVPYVQSTATVAKIEQSRLIQDEQRQVAGLIRKVQDPVTTHQTMLEKKKATAGPSWFNMPRTEMTPALRRDLQILSMRSVLDPKRHYKKGTTGGAAAPPAFSQVGTLIEGPTEFYSARIKNRDRRRTLAEEVLATERESGRFKTKYAEIQRKKTSGKKGDYKAFLAKRYGHKFKK